MILELEDTFSMRPRRSCWTRVEVAFDDERAVSGARLLLPVTFVERPGIEQATDQLVDLDDRPGRPVPGGGLRTVVQAAAVPPGWLGRRPWRGWAGRGLDRSHLLRHRW
jgi:hypothetical protein